MGVDFLDVLNEHGEDAVRRAIAGAVLIARGDERIVDRRPLSVARRVLEGLFRPPPEFRDTRWMLARHGPTDQELWLVYHVKGRRWRAIGEEQLRAMVRVYLDGFLTVPRRKCKTEDGGEVWHNPPLNVSKALLNDVIDAMCADCRVAADELPAWTAPTFAGDGRPWWVRSRRRVDEILFDGEVEAPIRPADVIAYPNGLLDVGKLPEIVMRPHTPLWFSEQCQPFDLPVEQLGGFLTDWTAAVDAGERDAAIALEEELYERLCPVWHEKLRQVWPDPIERMCVQKIFGYVKGTDRSHQVIALFQGPAGSFKGTCLWMMGEMLGSSENVAQMTLKKLGESQFALAYIIRRQLLQLTDAHAVGRDVGSAVEIIKMISGEDLMTVEKKHAAFEMSVKPRCAIVMAANDRLRLPDPSGSLQRRLVIVKTHRVFEGKDKDIGLRERLRPELPGVSAWALIGLLKLRRLGRFVMGEAGMRELDEVRSQNAPVYAWVRENCVVQPGSRVITEVLYRLFVKAAKDAGYKDMNAATFGSQLKSAFPSVSRSDPESSGPLRGKRWYEGIRPLSVGEEIGASGEPCDVTSVDEVTPCELLGESYAP